MLVFVNGSITFARKHVWPKTY